jgi:hypothetical protein
MWNDVNGISVLGGIAIIVWAGYYFEKRLPYIDTFLLHELKVQLYNVIVSQWRA